MKPRRVRAGSSKFPLLLHLPIEQDPSVWNKLAQEIKVRNIASYNRPAELTPLQKNKSVVEALAFGADGIGTEAKQNPSENPRCTPRIGVGRRQAMRRNIPNRLPYYLERAFSSSVVRAQPSEQMG